SAMILITGNGLKRRRMAMRLLRRRGGGAIGTLLLEECSMIYGNVKTTLLNDSIFHRRGTLIVLLTGAVASHIPWDGGLNQTEPRRPTEKPIRAGLSSESMNSMGGMVDPTKDARP